MSIYGLAATSDGRARESHRSVLASTAASMQLLFHGDKAAIFEPENCSAVLIAGGNISRTPEGVEHILRYSEAMRWFSASTVGISLHVERNFDNDEWEERICAIDSLNTIAVSDPESARILRNAGVRNPVLVCADLDYLRRVPRRFTSNSTRKPVLGVVAGRLHARSELIRSLASDFEIRFVSQAAFEGVDLCLTSEREGVILSVLHEIPFAVIGAEGDAPQRECNALGYPQISDPREAWSERVALQEKIHEAKPHRVRLARRNIEVLQNVVAAPMEKKQLTRDGSRALLVWAAPDQYWEEAQTFLASLGSGFDCLFPADSEVAPPQSRRRIAVPAGTLMHWSMFPESLRRQIEDQYDQTIVCHAFTGTRQQLAEIAGRTGRTGWEFRLWTHSCESYS